MLNIHASFPEIASRGPARLRSLGSIGHSISGLASRIPFSSFGPGGFENAPVSSHFTQYLSSLVSSEAWSEIGPSFCLRAGGFTDNILRRHCLLECRDCHSVAVSLLANRCSVRKSHGCSSMVIPLDVGIGCGYGRDIVVGYRCRRSRSAYTCDTAGNRVGSCGCACRCILFPRLEELGSSVRFSLGVVLGFLVWRIGG